MAEWARGAESEVSMQTLLEITSDGDIIDDGETYTLFAYDPESLGDDPIE
jgi:hypothetical protein